MVTCVLIYELLDDDNVVIVSMHDNIGPFVPYTCFVLIQFSGDHSYLFCYMTNCGLFGGYEAWSEPRFVVY